MITITEIKENLGSIIWLTFKFLIVNIAFIYLLQFTLGVSKEWFIIPVLAIELGCAIYYLRTPLFIDYETVAVEMVQNTKNMQAEVQIHKANFNFVLADYNKSKANCEKLKADLNKSKADYESIKAELKQIDLLQNQIAIMQNQKEEQKKQFESWAEKLRVEKEQIQKYATAIKFIETEFKEGKEISMLMQKTNIADLDIALKKLRAAINPKLNTLIIQ
jgi:hypothetical protein